MYSPILETLFATPSLPLFFRKEGIKKSTKWFVSGSRHYSWEKVNSHKKIWSGRYQKLQPIIDIVERFIKENNVHGPCVGFTSIPPSTSPRKCKCTTSYTCHTWIKGTVSRDFCFWFFSWISFPPTPLLQFQIFFNIWESRCTTGINDTEGNLPPVSATPVANFSTIIAGVVDTGGKFATGVNDTDGKFATGVNDASGKLPPVSITLAAK